VVHATAVGIPLGALLLLSEGDLLFNTVDISSRDIY